MLTDDYMQGIRKVDLLAKREIKVKLPVQQLMVLHYLKLARNQSFSAVVEAALQAYIAQRISVPAVVSS